MQHTYDHDLHMKIELVEHLVTALRSGEYKQTKTKLRDENGFCCLGVGCDLYATYAGGGFWSEVASRRFSCDNSVHIQREYYFLISSGDEISDRNPSVLPSAVAKAFGFDADDPKVHGVIDIELGDTPTLARLNDAGFTFSQIADIIEYFWLNRLRSYTRPNIGDRVRARSANAGVVMEGVVVDASDVPHYWEADKRSFAFVLKCEFDEFVPVGFLDHYELITQPALP